MTKTESRFLSTLESHLEGLRENGATRVPWKGPMPTAPKKEPEPAPKPRQQVTPPQVPVAETPKPVMPPSPAPKNETVSAATATPTLRVLKLERLAECADDLPAEETRILLVLDAAELEAPNRKLLSDMLYAVGYGLEQAEPITWDQQSPLEGTAERMLVMGNEALQATSSAGMDLQIVRGMWQQSPHGKLLSTFPPSYLQENTAGKKAAWSDLQKLLKDLELSLPDWTRNRTKKS